MEKVNKELLEALERLVTRQRINYQMDVWYLVVTGLDFRNAVRAVKNAKSQQKEEK